MTRARSLDSRARSVAQISGSTSWCNVISATHHMRLRRVRSRRMVGLRSAVHGNGAFRIVGLQLPDNNFLV